MVKNHKRGYNKIILPQNCGQYEADNVTSHFTTWKY